MGATARAVLQRQGREGCAGGEGNYIAQLPPVAVV